MEYFIIQKKKNKKKRKKNNCKLIENPVRKVESMELNKEIRSLTKEEINEYMLKEGELCETLSSLHAYRPYMYACAVTNNNDPMMIIPNDETYNIKNDFRMVINPLTKEFNGEFETEKYILGDKNPENHSNVWGVKSLVLCAGWIVLNENKKIIYIDRHSGHFKPDKNNLKCVVKLLKAKYPNCIINPHDELYVNNFDIIDNRFKTTASSFILNKNKNKVYLNKSQN